MKLIIQSGPGAGKTVDLERLLPVEIGRDPAAGIPLDDRKASRRHARIDRKAGGVLFLEDLGSTNGTFVGSKKISSLRLDDRVSFRIGDTVFRVEASGPVGKASKGIRPSGQGKRAGSKIWVLGLGALAFVGLLVVAVLFLRGGKGKEAASPDSKQADVAAETPLPEGAGGAKLRIRQEMPSGSAVKSGQDAARTGGTDTSPDEKPKTQSRFDPEASREHFRLGVRLYDSGRLKRAVAEWDMAVELDPGNTVAKGRLAKAVRELDGEIDRHYQAGLQALKYMREREAVAELRAVVELSMRDTDERYQDARRRLDALGETVR